MTQTQSKSATLVTSPLIKYGTRRHNCWGKCSSCWREDPASPLGNTPKDLTAKMTQAPVGDEDALTSSHIITLATLLSVFLDGLCLESGPVTQGPVCLVIGASFRGMRHDCSNYTRRTCVAFPARGQRPWLMQTRSSVRACPRLPSSSTSKG